MINIDDIEVRNIPNGTSWFVAHNGVEIEHKPSGIKVQYKEGRSYHYNRFKALEELERQLSTMSWPIVPVFQLVPTNINPTERPEYEKMVDLLRQPPKVLKNQNANEYYAMWWEQLLEAAKEAQNVIARKT